MLKYETFPNQSMVGGLKRYIEYGIPPGSFMMAILTNDLKEACGCADHINQGLIFQTVAWLWNEFPSTAWGSPEKVVSWMANKVKEKRNATD